MRVLLAGRFREKNRTPESNSDDVHAVEEEEEETESSIIEGDEHTERLQLRCCVQQEEEGEEGKTDVCIQTETRKQQRSPSIVTNNAKRTCRRTAAAASEDVVPSSSLLLLDRKPRAKETQIFLRTTTKTLPRESRLGSESSSAHNNNNTTADSLSTGNRKPMVSGETKNTRHPNCNTNTNCHNNPEEEHLRSSRQHRSYSPCEYPHEHELHPSSLVRRRRFSREDEDDDSSFEKKKKNGMARGLENNPARSRQHVHVHVHVHVATATATASSSPERIRSAPELCDASVSSGNANANASSSFADERSGFVRQEASPSPTENTNHPIRKRAPVHSGRRTTLQQHQQQHPLSAQEIRFRDLLKKNRGLEIKEQEGDGNCLFRAISLQVYGDPSMHGGVRKQCMDHMERDKEHFSQFVTGEPFHRYVARTRQDGVHGNNPEIQASSELFNRPIELFTPEHGSNPLNIFHTELYKTGDIPIRLSYHDGNHYNAVIDPLAPTAGLGLGLPGLQPPGYADKMQMAKAMEESMDDRDETELKQAMQKSLLEYKGQNGNGGADSDNGDGDGDDFHRAIKESRLSAEHMSSHNALSLSDMDATYFELEQAALERSMQSYNQKEDGKKQRASTTTSSSNAAATNPTNVVHAKKSKGDNNKKAVPVFSSSATASSLPCPSQDSIPAAASSSSSSSSSSVVVVPAAAVASPETAAAAAAASSKQTCDSPQRFLPAEEYPWSVQELAMNGFPLSSVVRAYDLVGNNYDDMLSLCLANNNNNNNNSHW